MEVTFLRWKDVRDEWRKKETTATKNYVRNVRKKYQTDFKAIRTTHMDKKNFNNLMCGYEKKSKQNEIRWPYKDFIMCIACR